MNQLSRCVHLASSGNTIFFIKMNKILQLQTYIQKQCHREHVITLQPCDVVETNPHITAFSTTQIMMRTQIKLHWFLCSFEWVWLTKHCTKQRSFYSALSLHTHHVIPPLYWCYPFTALILSLQGNDFIPPLYWITFPVTTSIWLS